MADIELEKNVFDVIKTQNPTDVNELIEILSTKYNIEREEALKTVIDLQDKNLIRFTEEETDRYSDLFSYIKSQDSRWYLAVIAASFIALFSVLLVPDGSPLVFLRYLLGFLMVILLPGYSTLRALYDMRSISYAKIILMSLGISVCIASVIGVILNFTPWGLTPASTSLTQFVVILGLASFSVYREFTRTKQNS